VADRGFDFGPVERRDAKRFEPPPWEQDRFDELSQRRAEEEAAGAALEEEARASRLEEPDAELDEAVSRLGHGPEGEHDAPATATATETTPITGGGEADPAAAAGLDDERVTAMLAQLAAEEPPAVQAFWRANVVVGAGMIAVGAVFLIWGMAAAAGARTTGSVGVFGGLVMLLFGGAVAFGGVYVVVKNLRQRGVL